jgi:hypothetical protein
MAHFICPGPSVVNRYSNKGVGCQCSGVRITNLMKSRIRFARYHLFADT